MPSFTLSHAFCASLQIRKAAAILLRAQAADARLQVSAYTDYKGTYIPSSCEMMKTHYTLQICAINAS